mgnify:CR=1 FL=1
MHVKEFAEKVERMCEFLLDKVPEGSDDRVEIIKLKEAAGDLQFDPNYEGLFDGLGAHIRGMPKEKQ